MSSFAIAYSFLSLHLELCPHGESHRTNFQHFCPNACPKSRKVHYSNDGTRLGDSGARRLVLENSNVAKWSFLQPYLTPALGQTLFHVRNVITYLETTLAQNPCINLHLTR